MRSKEEAFDYRYFPEPDLVPVVPDDEWRASVRAALPAMPFERRTTLATAAGVTPPDVALLVELDLDRLVLDAIAAGADAKKAINRAANEVAADLENVGRLTAATFAKVVSMESSGALTATQAKAVLGAILAGEGDDPEAIAAARGFEAMDSSALEIIIDDVIGGNDEAFAKFKAGDAKVGQMLVGQVMKKTQGKADGKAVNAILRLRAGLA
jgi:aspartyl-tRNA(Asn)/glutamyl-tRNA(Gln) amidotransferase subunit B